jgi:AcrR family transcriptional regulator
MRRAAIVPIDDLPKREAILSAALELFAERGFHGTAVPSIAEHAKVGAGTVYRYFASKEAIVNALYQRWKGEVANQLMTDFPIDAPARQQFHEMVVRFGRFALTHPRALAFLELHHHASYLDDASREIEERMMVPIRAFLAKAQEQQVVKPLDPELLIALVWGGFVGLLRASWDEGRLQLDAITLDTAEECLWEAIRR